MARLLTVLSLIFALVLFPPATLAFISQNAVPGELLYPVKRLLESGILAVASLTPNTKAYFASALVENRFKEAAALLAKGTAASDSLQDLITQTQTAAVFIYQVKDPAQKQQLVAKLSAQIDSYDSGLQQAQTGVPSYPTAPAAPSAPIAASQTNPIQQSNTVQTLPVPPTTASPQPQPVLSTSPQVANLNPPSPSASLPPPIVQSPASLPTPILSPSVDQQIEQAREQLEKIKDQLEKSQHSPDISDHRDLHQDENKDKQQRSSHGKD